jgi:hypothetical protein
MSLTELALLDDTRPLPLWDVIGLIKKKILIYSYIFPSAIEVMNE